MIRLKGNRNAALLLQAKAQALSCFVSAQDAPGSAKAVWNEQTGVCEWKTIPRGDVSNKKKPFWAFFYL